ncbi:MAG: di-trans,poly-cis-decaprenylcistransferase, partial [Candidatus Eremiobacteraeota bacterium]|nr:di-trans,poly-cis-decaprenylcistransferase [Candidatus Eremiobacteraeota bacterium]
EGHRAGAAALRTTARAAARAGIGILTVYPTSLDLVERFAADEETTMLAANVRVCALGRREALAGPARVALETLIRTTASCDGLLLNLAVDYGARRELGDAVRALAFDVQSGALGVEAIDDDVLGRYLYTAGLPDPDLLIRTGGELRVSNFLLYQIAYSELWATPRCWPDFGSKLLETALSEFAKRQRRFGS